MPKRIAMHGGENDFILAPQYRASRIKRYLRAAIKRTYRRRERRVAHRETMKQTVAADC